MHFVIVWCVRKLVAPGRRGLQQWCQKRDLRRRRLRTGPAVDPVYDDAVGPVLLENRSHECRGHGRIPGDGSDAGADAAGAAGGPPAARAGTKGGA